jgi:hypothetical protein
MDFRFDLCVLGECIKTGSSHLPFVKLVLHQENYQSWEINGSRKGGQKKLGRTIGTSVLYFLSFGKIFFGIWFCEATKVGKGNSFFDDQKKSCPSQLL